MPVVPLPLAPPDEGVLGTVVVVDGGGVVEVDEPPPAGFEPRPVTVLAGGEELAAGGVTVTTATSAPVDPVALREPAEVAATVAAFGVEAPSGTAPDEAAEGAPDWGGV